MYLVALEYTSALMAAWLVEISLVSSLGNELRYYVQTLCSYASYGTQINEVSRSLLAHNSIVIWEKELGQGPTRIHCQLPCVDNIQRSRTCTELYTHVSYAVRLLQHSLSESQTAISTRAPPLRSSTMKRPSLTAQVTRGSPHIRVLNNGQRNRGHACSLALSQLCYSGNSGRGLRVQYRVHLVPATDDEDNKLEYILSRPWQTSCTQSLT